MVLSVAKPLGIKAYGHIPHLIGSRMGPGDRHVDAGMARIATERGRDKYDHVIVQEKLDGSCTAVARVGLDIIPLVRAGYPAISSPYRQHHLFHHWVMEQQEVFFSMLNDGERAVGEWLAQAHGTRYDLTGRQPWAMFDIITGPNDANGYVPRKSTLDVLTAAEEFGFETPYAVASGPTSIEDAMLAVGEYGWHGALDPVEGAVWRIERRVPNKPLRVDLVKYVRPDKVDGIYLDGDAVWNIGGTDAYPQRDTTEATLSDDPATIEC